MVNSSLFQSSFDDTITYDIKLLRKIIGIDDVHFLTVLQRAVREGAKEALAVFNNSEAQFQTRYKKSDTGSPVTVADIRSADKIKEYIQKYYPDYSINEEESGVKKGSSDGIFFVDPLDGTSSFSRKQPFSTIGVIFYQNNDPLISTVCSPFEKKLFFAQKGHGSYQMNLTENLSLVVDSAIPLKVSNVSKHRRCHMFIDSTFTTSTREYKISFMSEAMALCNNMRSLGSNINHWVMVATGRAEAAFTDAVGGYYDLAGILLVTQAGGFVANLNGQHLQPGDQLAIGANSKELLNQLVAIAKKSYPPDYNLYGYRGKK